MSAPRHVLIVEDEPNVRLVFRTALVSNDYALSTAEDGESALRWLKQTPADMVLLDLQMPGMGGMEMLRRLREAGNDVPVVIVSAHDQVPNVVEAMRLGAIDFVSKPTTPEALRKVVAEVLARRAQPAPPIKPEPKVPPTSDASSDALTRAKEALNRRAFDEAEVFLKQAIGLEPNSAEAHNLKGVIHELRNELDASYREYKAALKADRHYEPAKHNITRYYERFTFGRSDIPVDTGDE
jgi:DNA-binding NtrC family response regulator